MPDLEGKVAVVTGGAEGIGRATAIEMVRNGARVVVADVNETLGRETIGLVEDEGGEALFVSCDVRDAAQVESLVAQAAERFGGIDVLQRGRPRVELRDRADGRHAAARRLGRGLRDQPAGRLVLHALRGAVPQGVDQRPRDRQRRLDRRPRRLPDVLGLLGDEGRRPPADEGDRDRPRARAVQLLPPGSTDTAMIRKYTAEAAEDKEAVWRSQTETDLLRRLGDLFDIAKLVCFLASEDASWITGTDFLIDGGSLAWRGHHLD